MIIGWYCMEPFWWATFCCSQHKRCNVFAIGHNMFNIIRKVVSYFYTFRWNSFFHFLNLHLQIFVFLSFFFECKFNSFPIGAGQRGIRFCWCIFNFTLFLLWLFFVSFELYTFFANLSTLNSDATRWRSLKIVTFNWGTW